ncbi:hypothetical protein ACIBJI_08185 [Nocardia sp. NPDC050408]|uniref:hypothetical protein n=1 Tax=Nocardia sp. NPDC050408 TaxID=3364319 RepID=UPI0037B5E738
MTAKSRTDEEWELRDDFTSTAVELADALRSPDEYDITTPHQPADSTSRSGTLRLRAT